MNKEARKALQGVINLLDSLDLDFTGDLETAKDDLQNLHDEEEAKFDNLTEGLQQSEMGQRIEAAKDALREAVDAVESALDALETMTDYIEEAKGAAETAQE